VTTRAEALEQEALKICDGLVGLKRTQDELAVALPEFAPYAGLDRDDIDDCQHRHGSRQ
jgi:hypothetical protein